MKRYILPLMLAAGPVAAHPGAHLHPHSVEGWVIGLGILACVVVAGAVVRARRSRK